jgi:hypothetical protein
MTEKPAGGGADQMAVPVRNEPWDRIVTCSWAFTALAVAFEHHLPGSQSGQQSSTVPICLTVARLELLTLQVAFVRGIPTLSIAVNCCVPPIIIFTSAGVICSDGGGGSVVVDW